MLVLILCSVGDKRKKFYVNVEQSTINSFETKEKEKKFYNIDNWYFLLMSVHNKLECLSLGSQGPKPTLWMLHCKILRLDWLQPCKETFGLTRKNSVKDKHSSLFCSSISDGEILPFNKKSELRGQIG